MAAGSEQARFERLYAQHFERVAAYLLARTDRDSAAEALSRTFEIAWRRLADVPAEPLPWLLGVARRVLSQQRRARRRRDALIERIAESTLAASPGHGEALAERQQLLAAIAALTPFQREALLLITWDGLSEREAASALGCSRGALALRLHRARRQLRSSFPQASTQAIAPMSDTPPNPSPSPNSPKEAVCEH
ncbi:MAG TPA: RNA polymerase sigma factor [Solirubrobacteraceae bacterium]|jgi:RNA polymerase sigma-70 factor (ECF subfamily)